MTTASYIVENDGTVTTKRDLVGFDIDPTIGSGATLSVMDAPEDYDPAFFAFDPFVA